MLKVLITSSVLITALLVLRRLFRSTMSRRIQYALWGLVLLRLLVPVSLPPMDFSVLTAMQPLEERVVQHISTQPVSLPALPVSIVRQQPVIPIQPPEQAGSQPSTDNVPVDFPGRTVSVKTLLTAGWIVGSAVMTGFLFYANLSFWRKLRRLRRHYPVEGCPLEVYLVDEELSSPCLFGLFRPSIYLTPAALASPARLCHVLAHEETHARHLDHIWTLLRGVCLVIYWFDPLVWLASAAAKTDCELACDESVLARLGEAERLPYGQTLLSLIPVGRAGNPMLTATTMAAGKKQLKDRFSRIARKPRQFAAAVLAALLLAGLVTACSFSGSKAGAPGSGESPDNSPAGSTQPAPEEGVLRALTGGELRFFNEDFFNGGGAVDEYGYPIYSILNQFANPTNLYSRAEDIDLYQLFYCESEEMSDADFQAAFDVGSIAEMNCPGYKLTVDGMNALLAAHTGLELEQTNKVGLNGFTYLEEYAAYYWMHGDTNYPGELFFPCGTREGDTIKLYQNSGFAPGWYCVTLEKQSDGSYWFRSNLTCDRPAIITPLPAAEPEVVISLKDLTPYEAPAVTVEPHVGDFVDTYENRLENWNIDGRNVVLYRATDGNIYAAIRNGEIMSVFLSEGLSEESQVIPFNDLLGHDGFAVSHYGLIGLHSYGTLVDYFYCDGNDIPVLLARASSWGDMPFALDLDGDGYDELATDSEIFFLREDVLYRAELEKLTVTACPAMDGWYGSAWNRYAKSLFVSGGGCNGVNEPRTIFRWLYFTREELRLYRDEKSHHNHMVDGVDQNVPAEVSAAACAYVENEVIEAQPNGTWRHKSWQDEGYPQETYDDWRIERISRSCVQTVGDVVIEGWTFNYELHVVDPENVVLAGGKYFTEDNWVSPGYPNCDWLFFRVETEERVFLWHDMINDMSHNSVRFQEYLRQNVEQFAAGSDTQ